MTLCVCPTDGLCQLQPQQLKHRMKHSDLLAESTNSPTLANDCVTSNGTYGFVHRNGVSVMPQRSLESPGMSRTCDILLDLERSSRSHSEEMTSDVMSKSYQSQYDDVPWLDDRMRMIHMSGDAHWRHDALLAAQVGKLYPFCKCLPQALGNRLSVPYRQPDV